MPGASVSDQNTLAGHLLLLALADEKPPEAETPAKGGSAGRGHPRRETDTPKQAVFPQPGGGRAPRGTGRVGREAEAGSRGVGLPVL